MATEPVEAAQPTFSDGVFQQQRDQARLGEAEGALLRARVLLVVVAAGVACAPVAETLHWVFARLADRIDQSLSGGSLLALGLGAVAIGLHHRRGGRDHTRPLAVGLALGAAISLFATRAVVLDVDGYLNYLTTPTAIVIDAGLHAGVALVVGAVVVGAGLDRTKRAGPGLLAAASVALIGACVAALVLPFFVIVGSIN